MSKGARELLRIVRKIYPNQRIITEHHVGERLLLDFFLSRYNLGFEYDGEQHFKYIEHFHGDRRGFAQAQKRDTRKEELCDDLNITLVRVAFDEPMTEKHVRSKILEALNG